MRGTLLAPYLLVAAAHLLCDAAGWDALAAATQVLLVPALALVLVGSARQSTRLVRLTRWALLFSWLGDTAPRLLDDDAAFGAMLGCFLVAQVFYISAFRPYAGRSVLRTRRGWLTPYVVALLALLATCAPAAGALAPAVVVYGCSLAAMAVLATGVNKLTWAGGAIFMASDSLIALDAFDVWTQPGHDVWVMGTYCVAQLLLVLGVLREVGAKTGEAAGEHPSVVPAG
ncbi:lysoplasmalogenase [Nocardioides sp. CER19]|uniref:lysoplasmalogenase n=1 Tax=Nocardioides sp. CER19 TaxID=3038538 RepID=UPI00244D2D32|nr:lysoplasmalogenase [Nocardioides sp. CER19]MDH2413710.1 lysoplasmalogenase [Nocardioides sp. CER19]